MPLSTWWSFAIATFFISASPGPNMLHMMASGMRHGLKPTFYTMAGCMLAVLSITCVSVAGVGAVLKTSPHLFDMLRYCGAAYLIYIGLKTMFRPGQGAIDSERHDEIPETATPRQHFKGGLMVGMSNPKLLLFATAFFPQFIDETHAVLPQFAILLFTCFWIELGWYIAYAAGGSRLAKYLGNPNRQKIMNRFIGALFTGFGLLLLGFRQA